MHTASGGGGSRASSEGEEGGGGAGPVGVPIFLGFGCYVGNRYMTKEE